MHTPEPGKLMQEDDDDANGMMDNDLIDKIDCHVNSTYLKKIKNGWSGVAPDSTDVQSSTADFCRHAPFTHQCNSTAPYMLTWCH